MSKCTLSPDDGRFSDVQYRSLACPTHILTPLPPIYATQLGVEYNKILISDLKYRWGSYTLKGNLNFNWRLIKAPHFVIDYIVVHELAHLLELNHSDRFRNIVRIQIPNYMEAKEWLRENGERVF